MATVILQFWEPSILYKRRILPLEEGIPCRVGRCHRNESPSTYNGLFDTTYPYISHDHAFILFSDNKFFLENSGKYGTLINGRMIKKWNFHQIFNQDRIQLGKDHYHNGTFQCLRFKVILSLNDSNLKYMPLIEQEYPNSVHLYSKPPTTKEMSLSELYSKTMERFEVLKILDKYGEIEFRRFNDVTDFVNEFDTKGYKEFHKFITRNLISLKDEYNWYQIDNITHHVLSIGCSRSYPLQRWFIKQETKLLCAKWKFLNNLEKIDVLNSCNIEYKKVGMLEQQELVEQYPSFVNQNVELYKIHFSHGAWIINNREYLLINGYAYISVHDLVAAVINKFENSLQRKLKEINKNLHKILSWRQIISMINYIEQNVSSLKDYCPVKRNITPNMVPELAFKSFPLCMNILNYYLERNHHLRNGGRLQYGLFLKGIGMSLSDSLKFWRDHFTQDMDIKDFEKNYSYHVRHTYGTVGRKFSYPPQNCDKILQEKPSLFEYHGCPFKTLDKENTMFELSRNNIPDKDAEEIWEIMEKGFPQKACAKYFNVKHKSYEKVIIHPNLYFERSQALLTSDGWKQNSNNVEKCLESCNNCAQEIEW